MKPLMICYSGAKRIREGLLPEPDLEKLVMIGAKHLHLWVWLMADKEGHLDPQAVSFYRRIERFCWRHDIKIIAKCQMFSNGIPEYLSRQYTRELYKWINRAIEWMYELPSIRHWVVGNEPQISGVAFGEKSSLHGEHLPTEVIQMVITDCLAGIHERKPVPVSLYAPALEPLGITSYGDDYVEPGDFLENLLPDISQYIDGISINSYPPIGTRHDMPTAENFVAPHQELIDRYPDFKFIMSEGGVADRWIPGRLRSLEQLKRYLELSEEIDGFPYTSYFVLHGVNAKTDDFALIRSNGKWRHDKITLLEDWVSR